MNLLNTSYKTGFPITASTIEFVQGQILLLQQLSLVNGQHYIISGCVDNSGTIGDGLVVVNGEVLAFVGGAVQTNVVIIETTVSKQFEDLQIRPYEKNRYATFGSTGITYAWADFERNDPANGVLKRMREAELLLASTASDLDSLESAFNGHTHSWASITGKPNGFISYAGSVDIGNVGAGSDAVGGQDNIKTVTIPNQGDENYLVLPAPRGMNSNLDLDNDVTFITGDYSANSFKVAVRKFESVTTNLKFGFVIIKL